MPSLLSQSPAVKSMLDVQAILKRGIGIHQATQVAADMIRNQSGLPCESVKFLPAEEKMFYRQLAEKVIGKFEEGAFDKEPASMEQTRLLEREAFLTIERQTARLGAASRGHEMGPWVNVRDRFDESSACTRCSRVAVLVVSYDPDIQIRREGSALMEGCLSAAPEVA